MCPDVWHLDVHVLWLLGSSQMLGLECPALRSSLAVAAASSPPGPGDSNLLACRYHSEPPAVGFPGRNNALEIPGGFGSQTAWGLSAPHPWADDCGAPWGISKSPLPMRGVQTCFSKLSAALQIKANACGLFFLEMALFDV